MNSDKQEFSRNIIRHIARLERQRRLYLDENLRAFKLRGVMFMIILYLDRHPGSNQDSLSEYLLIDKSGVARKCRELEDMGYIKREQSRDNRRQNELYLTENGQTLLPVIRSLLAKWREIVTKDMTGFEQKELLRLLELMEKNALNIRPS
ncbi:MAG: winged helix-turn-helix transcriptional regulator [Clostridiaceae bacterium]|jgi:DNA-binding MarR family transcriptional regulator|nr:winged helix-turn-helix transcriptional regulator [Clostridiaceae bacterium]